MAIKRCQHCGGSYTVERSTSWLRWSYCTGFCEGQEFGMTLRDWTNVRRDEGYEALRERIFREVRRRSSVIGHFMAEGRERGIL